MPENGFLKHNNIIIEKTTQNTSQVRLDISELSLNPYGIVHGGLIFAIGDTAMGVTIKSLGRNAVTLDASINYLHKCNSSALIAKSEIIKIGKTTSTLRANIYNEKEELMAIMTATYFFLD